MWHRACACFCKPNVTQHIIYSRAKILTHHSKSFWRAAGTNTPLNTMHDLVFVTSANCCIRISFTSVIKYPAGNLAPLRPAVRRSVCACERVTEPCDSLSLSKIGDEVLAHLIASSMRACGCRVRLGIHNVPVCVCMYVCVRVLVALALLIFLIDVA